MECIYCGGDMNRATTIYTGKTKSCVIVIKNIQCKKCTQCGDETYDLRTSELISDIVAHVNEIPLEMAVIDANKWNNVNND